MDNYYFAKDGSWGSIEDIVIIDIDEYQFDDNEWRAIITATEVDRQAFVERLVREYN